jgi:hypothetical protein
MVSDRFIAYHEECIDENVKKERGERVARVVVVPHADLDRHNHGCVDQKEGA